MRRVNKWCLVAAMCLCMTGCTQNDSVGVFEESSSQQGWMPVTEEELPEDTTEENNTEDITNVATNEWESQYNYYSLEGHTEDEFLAYCLGDEAETITPCDTYEAPGGGVMLELYHEEGSDMWYGIRYVAEPYGFIIDTSEQSEVMDVNTYPIEAVDDMLSADEFIAENDVYAYADESYLYDDEGRVVHYEVTGDIQIDEEIREGEYLYKYDYIYYTNGMTRKSYEHNLQYFGSLLHFQMKLYNADNRLIYTYDKIPLEVESFYIYEEGSEVPVYEVVIDGGVQGFPPQLLVYQ